jgi:amidohydrolase
MTSQTPAAAASKSALDRLIDQVAAQVVSIRRSIHARPELAYEEFETAAVIRNELARLGITPLIDVPNAPTATIALIGDPGKPCVALRADIDALPIREQTNLPYASTNEGKMHACGHDGHTAGLLATAAVLTEIASELPVCVKLIFQPAEEGGAGAERLVRAGVLDATDRFGPKVRSIYGLHGWPGLPAHVISTRPGPMLAATDTFAITVVGRGTHGAYPHCGRDPIIAAAELVMSLQVIVSRELDPTEPGVVTVGKLQSGTAVNVIPDEAHLEGTIRTLTRESRLKLRDAVARRAEAVAKAHGCEARITLRDGYPSTINDPASTTFVEGIARELFGPAGCIPAARPSMGGEDFAYYLERVPGCFFMVGVMPEGLSDYPPLHSDRYDFNDAVLPTCVRMFVEIARRGGV